MSSEISSSRSVRSTRSNNSSSSASSRLQSLLNSTSSHPLSIKYSSSLEHASHQKKEKGVRRSSTSSSSEKLTPREFLDKYSLPRVVKVFTPSGDGVKDNSADSEEDADKRRMLLGPLAEPLLLYRQYKSTKVQAKSFQNSKVWKTVGPSLVIPDSYKGWFSLLTPKGQLVAQCYGSIQQLIAAQISRFLTKTEVTAYKLNDNKDVIHDSVRKRLQYMKTSVPAGEVLKLLAVFEDVSSTNSSALSNKRLSLPLIGRSQNNSRYAQCILNHKNQVVFVPLTTTGQFFAVALGGRENASLEARQAPLYQLTQLLRDNRLPIQAQLVAGPLPSPLPAGFSGSLLLEDYQEEDVILACTLPSDAITTSRSGSTHTSSVTSPIMPLSGTAQPKLLEMDADSRFFLSRPLFHHDFESRFFKSPLLQTALAFCRDRGDLWRRQIKVTHHIFPSAASGGVGEGKTGKKSTTHQQPTQEGQEKVSKTKNKSRRTTKKSSSFTYTPSSSRGAANATRDLSDYRNAISQQRTELHGQEAATDAERLLHSFTPSICHHKNESRLQQRPFNDPKQSEVESRSKSHIYSNAQNRDLPPIVPSMDDLPYSHVADALEDINKYEEENIYAEICECETRDHGRRKLNYYYLNTNSERVREDYYYVQLEGGSDGTFSGTMSSSNPSSPDDDNTYDTVC